MTNATVVEEPRTKSSSNVVARFRSIREELKKFKDLKEGLVKIRDLFDSNTNTIKVSKCKRALQKVLMLFCFRRDTALPKGIESTDFLTFTVQIFLTFQAVVKSISYHSYTMVPVEVFTNLVEDRRIPIVTLFNLAKQVSIYHPKLYHLLTILFIRNRLFPDIVLQSIPLSWETDSFSLDSWRVLISLIQYLSKNIQISGVFLRERREAILLFLRLIPFFRTAKSVSSCPLLKEKEELWTQVLNSFKFLGSRINKRNDIEDELKDKISTIEFSIVSVSTIL